MKYLYEYSDILHAPVEAFYYDSQTHCFPIEQHWHYFVEIIYVLEGSAWLTCNQQSCVLTPGEMMFIPPQAVHSISTTTPLPLRYVVLKFDPARLSLPGDYLPKLGTLFKQSLQGASLPLTFSGKDFGDFPLDYFFHTCVREMQEKQYGYDSSLYASLALLMIQILRRWRALGFPKQAPAAPGGEETFSFQDLLVYIDRHSQERLRVQELADMCHMSYSYFARVFHRLYGQSCKEYIEFIRLSKVENLLLFTDYDLTYISEETGFADCSHLIRSFRRKYKITPKQYRLQHKQPA